MTKPNGRRKSPGRPKKSVEKNWIAIARDTVSYADIEQIVQRAVADAKKGNAAARAFLFDRVCGKPNLAPPPDGSEGEERREVVFKLLKEDAKHIGVDDAD